MNDPVISESLTLRYEVDGSAVLTGFVPGPAGEVSIESAPGIEVAFDAANPAQASSITVQPRADMAALAELIGEERSRLVRPGSVDQGRRTGRLPRVGPSQREFASLRREGAPSELARTAVSLSLGRDLRRSSLARAVALLEAYEARRHGMPGLRTDDAQLQELMEDAEDLVTGVPHEVQRLIDADPDAASRVAHLFVEAEQRAPMLYAIGRAIRSRVDQFDQKPDRGAEPKRKKKAQVQLFPNGRLQARGVGLEGRWIRVLRGKPLTLLAAAPFVAVGDELHADVVLPPDLVYEDLDIKVTTDPMPLDPSSPFEAIRFAVMLGRRAVDEHHNGRYEQARLLWLDCSSAWDLVGDTSRANRAKAYADQGFDDNRPTTLSERVQRVLRRP